MISPLLHAISVVTGMLVVGPVFTSQTMNSAYPCPDAERVCASTLRVGPHSAVTSAVDEGPYCTCETCPKHWDETGDQSLTWHHHERSHWVVQYKFCEPIIPKKTCADTHGIAAIVEADSHGWNPRLKSMTCRCPKGDYYLKGWMLEGQKHWDYHYTCERVSYLTEHSFKPGLHCCDFVCDTSATKPVCSEQDACVKHYMDAKLKKTAGYRFMCSCTEGSICPTNKIEGAVTKVDGSDDEGPYINGYCRKIQSHLRKEYTDRMNKNNAINRR